MKVVLSIPKSSTSFETKDILEKFKINGENIIYSDNSGGPDWNMQFLTHALAFFGVQLITISTEFSKEIGKSLGKIIGEDSVKLYKAFKESIKKVVSKKERALSISPYIFFQVKGDKRIYEFAFELGYLNEKDVDESFELIIESIITFISLYEKSNILIDDPEIGIKVSWSNEIKGWKATSIESITNYNLRFSF
jgi:hypothetical protein